MSWAAATCAERAFASRGRAVAAIDLGTNNCRLMIAKRRKSGFAVVATFSRIVRLGEGLVATGRLAEGAMDRTVDALKECAEIIARWDVASVRAVATEACRSAGNGAAFLERVRRETGLRLEVIGPAEEARLALISCSPLISRRAGRAVLFDIGGGSTEISFLEVGHDHEPELCKTISLPVGVVRVAEAHPVPFTVEAYRKVRADMAAAVREQGPRSFLAALDPANDHLIGTSGTATSLAAFHKGLKRYRRREIDGSWLGSEEIAAAAKALRSLGQEGRAETPCVGSGRADLIMPGCALLEGILEATGLRNVRVADRGLREGVVTELLAERSAARHAAAAAALSAE
ncbi:Ppx/GppA phosphatase family protein [Parvularcula maris]|uniref:Ppx/GppA family phosphatase n=1 Tax=Parvularcula maris TaxID=2965077 RepID=A0A9X2LAL5_9PROT|nr:Ppx/GppA phosphatase family protein [Parvularcula maris]MCQ8186201.1 Ppx/GppA family phosphatase [Parvularcula maris]